MDTKPPRLSLAGMLAAAFINIPRLLGTVTRKSPPRGRKPRVRLKTATGPEFSYWHHDQLVRKHGAKKANEIGKRLIAKEINLKQAFEIPRLSENTT